MLLSFLNVTQRFGPFVALDRVSCELNGRAIGLLGPNGAGKTTLMKVCLGLIAPDSGEARLFGLDVRTHGTEVRGRLGYAAEGAGRLPGLTGVESVAYMGELCGLSRRLALRRAHEVLDLVGLDESRHRPVETYSTGMHQRVKVAMALVHDPELLLLDEPTSGLDPESRDDFLELIVSLRQNAGPAIVLSTHLLHDVERTCEDVIIMHRGRVRYAGSLAALQGASTQRIEVRTRGPAAALLTALRARGAQGAPGRREDTLEVTLRPPLGPETIWQAAAELGAVIWHLEPQVLSLEEAFLATLATTLPEDL